MATDISYGDCLPLARREECRVYELDGENVVYDVAHDTVHYLNGTSCFIWQRCDGRRSMECIAKELADSFMLDSGRDAERQILVDVQNTVAELARNGLLEFAGGA